MGRIAAVPETVGDGVAAVAAEGAAGELYARRSLPTLVLGDIKQMLDPPDRFCDHSLSATISLIDFSSSTKPRRIPSSTSYSGSES
jgi:hypothetical protein